MKTKLNRLLLTLALLALSTLNPLPRRNRVKAGQRLAKGACLIALALLSTLDLQPSTFAQGTAFSYQGRLNDGGSPATGIYDLRFTVCDALTSGNVVAGPKTNSATGITNGLFAVILDFGSGVFTGSNRWVEIAARTNGAAAFTTLAPRQPIQPVPYAIMANSASNLLGNLPAGQLSGTIPLAQLPGAVVTNNNVTSVTLNGAFTGSGANLTSLNANNLSSGTVPLAQLNGITSNQLDAATWQLATNLNGGRAALASNVVAGITITNAFITNSVFAGNGAGLTNLNASQFSSGSIPLAELPAAVITNNSATLTIGGTNAVAPLTVPLKVPSAAVGSATTGANPASIAVAGRYAYVLSESVPELQIFDVSTPSTPALIGAVGVTVGGISISIPWSVAVAGRYAYVVSADPGGTLQIYDVSNPSAPVPAGYLSGFGPPYAVAVAGRYAYVGTSGNKSLQIIDVSNPSAPVSVGSVATTGTPFSVAVAGRYAYVADNSANALQIIDVSNPSAPASVGSVTTGTSSSTYSVAVAGRYAYVVNYGSNTLQVIDVSNPANPVSVGLAGTGNHPKFVAVAGRYAYVANATASTLQIFDVSTPSAPVSLGSVATGSSQESLAVEGRYVYVANYSGNTLQVFDLGGAYLQQLEAGALETGTLQTRDTATVGNNLDVRGGLTVSASARISGGLSVDNGSITATNFVGSGAGLTSLNAANLTGSAGNFSATNITITGSITGNGAGLTNLNVTQATGSSAATPPASGAPILNMVWIVPGTFIMGSPSSETDRLDDNDDETQHLVTLTNGFWMGHHPVTQGEYLAVVGSNPSVFTGDLTCPVEAVTWYNATNFCYLLTQEEQSAGRLPTGWVYRLPTEAEWEYCCRALTTTRFYYGYDPGYTNLVNYAWAGDSAGTPLPVGQLLPNAWGLVDMAGNVMEWCQDWYGAYPTGNVSYNPQGPATGSNRVIRGACFLDPPQFCRSAHRFDHFPPTYAFMNLGFRVVLAPH
jgi:YVTN family beta-propeller protein